jgi:formylglycine-generating enzyme required for sulfatase activity
MSWNLAEWTRSRGGRYPYPEPPGEREALSKGNDEARVVRGATNFAPPSSHRAACRSFPFKEYGLNALIGFRLVVSRLRS